MCALVVIGFCLKKQVQACEYQMYQKSESAKSISDICLLDMYLHECSESCPAACTKSSLWICYTCHRKIMSGKTPAEAAVNSMKLEDVPLVLTKLNSLEQHLIAIHIPFMKIMVSRRIYMDLLFVCHQI